jgi:hypothetical protein
VGESWIPEAVIIEATRHPHPIIPIHRGRDRKDGVQPTERRPYHFSALQAPEALAWAQPFTAPETVLADHASPHAAFVSFAATRERWRGKQEQTPEDRKHPRKSLDFAGVFFHHVVSFQDEA